MSCERLTVKLSASARAQGHAKSHIKLMAHSITLKINDLLQQGGQKRLLQKLRPILKPKDVGI